MLHLQTTMNFLFCVYICLVYFDVLLFNAIGLSANCWNYSSHGITFFRFVGFYDSIKTWWNRIGRIKLEISSSFKLLLFTKSCKVFLDFTCKCRCSVSARYYKPLFKKMKTLHWNLTSFYIKDSLALYFHQFENSLNQCSRNITFWIIKLL